MGEKFLKAAWTSQQPWRGLFVLIITVLISFIIATSFDIEKFTGIVGYFAMSCICMFIVMGPFWKGSFPTVAHVSQPIKGILLLIFAMVVGLLICNGLINFIGGGELHPYLAIHTIVSLIMIFIMFFFFEFWPFNKLSVPAGGFLLIVTGYVIGLLIVQFFNFDLLSYPTGANPSPIGAVPFYGEGGPLAIFHAPSGPILWEHGISYLLWVGVCEFSFPLLNMWPFRKLKIKQPLMGIVITISSLIIAYVAFNIGIHLLKIEPLTFMAYGVSLIFGVLIVMMALQMWPGREMGASGEFINYVIAIILAFIGYFAIRAFFVWNFGEGMVYPNNNFAISTIMLGLLFPMWSIYGDFFNFWPLPPLDLFSSEKPLEDTSASLKT